MANGPILFEIEDEAESLPDVSEAPPVPEVIEAAPEGQAMQIAARLAARKPSMLTRLFWGLAVALIGALVSIAAWNFITDLIARYPLLGWGVSILLAAFLAVLALICLRELAAFGRLSCLLYTSPSPRDRQKSRMPSSA